MMRISDLSRPRTWHAAKTLGVALVMAAMLVGGGMPAVADTATPEPTPGPTEGTSSTAPTEPGLDGTDTPVDAPPPVDDGTASITPFAVGGPDGPGLATPYVYWTVTDQAGAPLGGATFQIAGPRSTSISWSNTAVIVDNVGQVGYAGLDLDPSPGEFAVMNIASHRIVNSGNDRYRIRIQDAPDGYVFSSAWVEMPGQNNNGTWNNGNGAGTHNFGEFRLQAATATITVNARVIRKESTGPAGAPGQDLNNAAYLEGITYRLYTNNGGQPGVDSGFFCTIPAAATSCDITVTGVDSINQYVVVEVSNASTYENPVYMTGSSSGPTIAYYYAGLTPMLAAGGAYQFPRDAPGQTGNNTRSSVLASSLDNPQLQLTCQAGLRIAIQMDVSGSVSSSQRVTYRNSLHALFDSLVGTGVEIALFSFSQVNLGGATPTPRNVDNPTQLQGLKDTVTTLVNGGGSTTNWDLALRTVANENLTHDYDMLLFMTDGAPNVISNANGSGSSSPNGSNVAIASVEQAIFSANALKTQGVRVAAVGIGNGITGEVWRNLAAVSGPTEGSDFYRGAWEDLETDIKNIVAQALCTVPVEVTKYELDAAGANPVPGEGWSMNLDLRNTTSPATVIGADPQLTNASGTASWTIKFTQPGATTDVMLTETLQTGWSFHSGTYTVFHANGTTTTGDLTGTQIVLPGIKVDDRIAITYNNIPVPQDGSASWNKIDGETGELLGGSTWQLDGPSGYSQEIVDNTGQTPYTGLDVDPATGAFRVAGLPAGEYTLTELAAPVGYEAMTGTRTVTVVAGNNAPTPIEIENTRKTGTVTWAKVSTGTDDTPLGGSSWRITGPGLGPDGILVSDFEGTPPNPTGRDQNGAPGGFLVEGLAWGDFTVTEEIAPVGYELSDPAASFTFTISATSLIHDHGNVTNDQVKAITLPIAGGTGNWPYLAGGFAILLTALAAWLLVEQRRRRHPTDEEHVHLS